MAKANSIQPKIRRYFRIARAATECGIPQQTLDAAVRRGDVPHITTGCDLRLVSLADVREYMRGEHPGGQYGRRAAWRKNA